MAKIIDGKYKFIFKTISENLHIQIIIYNVLFYITSIGFCYGFSGIVLIILDLLLFIILPLILIIKIIVKFNKIKFQNTIKTFVYSFFVFLPLTHSIGIVTFVPSHGNLNMEIFLYFGKIAIIYSFFGGLISILCNSVYILSLRILKKA